MDSQQVDKQERQRLVRSCIGDPWAYAKWIKWKHRCRVAFWCDEHLGFVWPRNIGDLGWQLIHSRRRHRERQGIERPRVLELISGMIVGGAIAYVLVRTFWLP